MWVFGGMDGKGNTLDDLWRLKLLGGGGGKRGKAKRKVTGGWEAVKVTGRGSRPVRRWGHSACLWEPDTNSSITSTGGGGMRMIVFGGMGGDGKHLNETWELNLER